MAGNESLTLNRPKYLSDQLWNKVLLNSMFNKGPSGSTLNDTVQNISNDQRTMLRGHSYDNKTGNEPLDTAGPVGEMSYGYNEITILRDVTNRKNKHETNVDVIISNQIKAREWQAEGYNRYHTTIVRYVEWFVHLQRVMRLLMRDQLSWVNDPIVHKSNVINEQVTEYDSNRKFELSDFE